MDDLVQWLTTQLDEDERIARAADADLSNVFTRIEVFDAEMAADERHIVTHGPARVLREIDAKRRIVERYAWLREHGDTGDIAWVLPLLALPYEDREGFREEWRP
ncbi:DUF6221 family protein [Streptomyces bauhiniae]|uniref:DUF6221 family protein n=1 Tax=Streptomyces bauhiniae TaxID=2340725 RepID=UPI0033BA32D4